MGNTLGGLVVAIFLLLLGVILVAGLLDWLLRVIGIVCLVAGVIVGAIALFGRKNRYGRL